MPAFVLAVLSSDLVGSSTALIAAGAAVLLLALLIVVLVVRSRRAHRRAAVERETQRQLEAKPRPPPPAPAPKPLTQQEKDAAEAQRKAEYDARKAAERAAKAAREAEETEAERARKEAEARQTAELAQKSEAERREQERLAREAEEERKKEAYRKRKEEERAEKERKRLEQEEEQRRIREEQERLAREAEEAKRREEEERQKRVEAEAGRTLAAGLEKTRGGFMARLNGLFSGGKAVDDKVLADLEEVLFTADIGVRTATSLLEAAREHARAKELADPEKLKGVLRKEIARIVSFDAEKAGASLEPKADEPRPRVVMVVGVNGAGKTTTVGKLASKLRHAGHQVLLGAGDTFRAAAGEQLEIWAERVGAPIVRGPAGGDPASVCFEAVKTGIAQKVDVVICDTAGRLHTKLPLMEELKKVKRVMDKALPGAPHEVILVVDATNGQNAIAQARQFNEALGVTGIVLTKLDGTAKGGVIIGICDELKIPVRYVGVGEQVADLRPFQPAEYVEALFGE